MQPFAKGKRSLVYKHKNKVVKQERTTVQTPNRIKNEAHWLRFLNKKNIGPKFVTYKKNAVTMEYIKGPTLEQFLKTATKDQKKKILLQLLDQAYILDTLKVNKLEMHRVTKNAIVRNNKLILLDFERCKKTPYPKNITQTCQFIAKHFPSKVLREKARIYKATYAKKDFMEMKKWLTNTS